jgi:MoaD family protein
MARLRLFANLREAAGTSNDEVPGATVGDVLDAAVDRYGSRFSEGLGTARVWVNGEPAQRETPIVDQDEVALIPPVSGGAMVTPSAEVGENVLSLALVAALLIGGLIALDWFVLIAVGAALAWLWDLSDQSNAATAGFNVLPALFTPVAAATGAYAWGFEGFAGGMALGIAISVTWPVFDAGSRNLEMIMVSTTASLIAGLGSAGLVLLRMISTRAVVAFVVIALTGLIGAWLAQIYGAQVQSMDPNFGGLLGALFAGTVVGLSFEGIDTAAAILGAVAVAAGLIAGRALGSLLRRGQVLHTQRAPGILTSFDGVIVAAPIFWLTLWVFG